MAAMFHIRRVACAGLDVNEKGENEPFRNKEDDKIATKIE